MSPSITIAFWPSKIATLSPPTTVGVSILVCLFLVLCVLAYRDYTAWYELGAGGPPHSIWGWLLAYRLGFNRLRDVKSTDRYDVLINEFPDEAQSYLGMLPVRSGPAPQISDWVAPIRQLTDVSDEKLKEELFDIMTAFGAANPSLVVAPSAQEKGHGPRPNALLLRPDLPAAAINGARLSASMSASRARELYHVHWSDSSAHCVLSAADARMVIARGWGEAFPLAGVNEYPGFPPTYVMVYAPRDAAELRVHAAVMRAAVAYALSDAEKVMQTHA